MIALYMRISNQDVNGSIANQRMLLRDFIGKTPEFARCKITEFTDDGFTGTNFARPGVQQLIEAARCGRIQCIIVKDLSRFGRNYIEVGDYLEQKFPAWGVRFIAPGDNYDSARRGNTPTDSAFRNLIYQIYSQDLSVKCRSGKDAATKRGKIISPYPAFGYDKDKNDRHKLVPDPIDAPIVLRIFNLAEQGHSVPAIAKLLNAENIPTKQMSKHRKGFTKKWGRGSGWNNSAVRDILQNECYTGKWIYGKTRTVRVGARAVKKQPRSKWIIVPGALPAIITEEQFAAVQAKLKTGTKKRTAGKSVTIPPPAEKPPTTQKCAAQIQAAKIELWERCHNKLITRQEFMAENERLNTSIQKRPSLRI